MARILMVNAPPTLFDDFEAIIEGSAFSWSRLSTNSQVREIRRRDTAAYEITLDGTRVRLVMERRLGNPTMCIALMPNRQSLWRADIRSERLAENIVEILVENGANGNE